MERIHAVLAGAGGYGHFYLDALLGGEPALPISLIGVADPHPPEAARARLNAAGVPCYPSLEAFYAAGGRAELAILAVPIAEHLPQCRVASANGSAILLEKPLAATLQEAADIAELGCPVAVGYQWSYSRAILNLKADIAAGRYGAPLSAKTLVLWPRLDAYFARPWAARRFDAAGRPVFDSIAHNACAHYLHNLLFLLGPATDRAAEPERVRAGLWRANDIENFDTCAIQVLTCGGVPITFVASHATERVEGPVFEMDFIGGRAVAAWHPMDGSIHVMGYPDGERPVVYGDPNDDERAKLYAAARMARDGQPPVCGIAAALPELKVISALERSLQAAGARIAPIPGVARTADDAGNYVPGLHELLKTAYRTGATPDTLGLPEAGMGAWVSAGK